MIQYIKEQPLRQKAVSFFGGALLTWFSPHDEAAELGNKMSPPRRQGGAIKCIN